MGVALKAPLCAYDKIYTLPMLTIKEDKGKLYTVTKLRNCSQMPFGKSTKVLSIAEFAR